MSSGSGMHLTNFIVDPIRQQSNVFVIGTKATPVITLPRQKGIKHGIIEEARRRAEKAAKN